MIPFAPAAVAPLTDPACTRLPVPQQRVGAWQLLGSAVEGAWTQVFRAKPAGAHDGHTGSYAVKMLRHELNDDPLAKEMLFREARVAADVQHKHLIAVLESQLCAIRNSW